MQKGESTTLSDHDYPFAMGAYAMQRDTLRKPRITAKVPKALVFGFT